MARLGIVSGAALSRMRAADTILSDLELDITMAESVLGLVLALLALVLGACWRITTPVFAPGPVPVRPPGERIV